MMAEDAPPRAAATVVLFRPAAAGPEVLLTLRPSSMAFAPDMYVFPGGAVDPSDDDPRLAARSVLGPADAAAALGGGGRAGLERYIAAIRELFEEAGVLLADPRPDPARAAAARAALLDRRSSLADVAEDLDVRLRTDLLVPTSHWTTPPIMARRFDTRFFAAELPPGAEVTFAPDEVVAHRWATPRGALDAMAAGEIAMWVPTGATLQQLEHVRDLDDVRRRFIHGPVAAPRVVVERPDLRRIVVSGAGGVPGRTANTCLVGRRDIVVVDPGDPSDEAARAVMDAVSALGARIVAIALTSSDPDHAGGAEGLALRLGVPIFGSPGAGHDLPYEVQELGDGELFPVGDTELVAIAIEALRLSTGATPPGSAGD
jgi:8-oxo-dGTP pyrophosphatase MutT (NUDIX family)